MAVEPILLDFGDPAHHHHLTAGWSGPERSESGSWAWATSKRARIELELAAIEYRELAFRCWPFIYPESPPQTLELVVNGRAIRSLELRPRRHTYTLSLPEGVLRRGRNRLDLGFRYVESPSRKGLSEDSRSLAAAFDFLRLSGSAAGAGLADGSPNVLLISIDTLRADRLGSYGYDRNTSPALDALAAEGVRFSQAVSQSPWTTPSHMSLLTSLYPSAHRVNQGWSELLASYEGKAEYRVLPEKVRTLAEVLRDYGYRTFALTGGATVAAELGFAQGFDVYHEGFNDHHQGFYHLNDEVWAQLTDWLIAARTAPFFLFFHTFEVHAPYVGLELAGPLMTESDRDGMAELLRERHPSPIDAQRQYLEDRGLYTREITSALYDGGVRRVDAFLGRLFDELRRLGLYDETLIVVTSDHGEEFGEHDPKRFFDAHCNTVYEELIRVPLIFRLPGRPRTGGKVDQPVELIDVAPTLLDLLGIQIPLEMQGRSLKDLILGGAPAAAARAVSEATCVGAEMKALRAGRFKYIAAFTPPDGERTGLGGVRRWERLFDLEADPREQNSLDAAEPELLGAMRRRLREHFRTVGAPATGEGPTIEVGTEARERLRALGYLQ